jgi:DNA-binding NtrC family response regulator
MAVPTALLITRNPAMVEAVQGALAAATNVNLEVCPGGEDAREQVKGEIVILVLVDPEAAGGDAGVTHLLWTIGTTRRACPTLVVTTHYTEHQAITLLRAGAADYVELPSDRDKLAPLIARLWNRHHICDT